MTWIYIREYVGKDPFWKTLCVVIDNEGLGIMERLLKQAGIEFKTETH